MAEIGISLGINAGSQGVPNWVLNNAALDMYFSQGTYFSATGSPVVTDLITTTRASTGYAATSSGLLVSFLSNIPRITDLGLLVEQAATNVVLWNRDLTNAVWTKSNITAALNQTGADGTANAATSLTATAGNGTCLQAITLASSARFQSAYVKRLTGSGVINMTMDNGATWTAIVVTAAYTQLTIPTQTLANPTVGFRIVTSGDAIAVDFVGNENSNTNASSPIATTTVAVTRAADAITLAGAALTAASLTTLSVFAKTLGLAASGNNAVILGQNGVDRAFLYADHVSGSTALVSYDGTNVFSTGNGADFTSASVPVKGATTITPSTRTLCVSGGTVASQTNLFAATTSATVGNNGGATRALNGYLQRLAIWPVGLSNAQLQALTT